jgi:site-specific recombinase XerD
LVPSSTPDSDVIAAYLAWLSVEKGRRPATREAYLRDITRFNDWLNEEGINIRKCTPNDFDRFVATLRQAGLSQSSISRTCSALRGFFNYAISERLVLVDPTAAMKPARRKKTLPKPISEQQMFKLLDSLPGESPIDKRDSALLELLYGTGCRVSEAIGIRLGDLDFSEMLIKVTGKGAKQRLVPIGSSLLRRLEPYLQADARTALLNGFDSDRLFLNSRGGDLSRQGVDLIIRSRALAAGVSTIHLSAHVFRHSCATHMLEHGADIRVVQELLGHASIATTQAYTAVTVTSLRREYLGAHPRAKG